MKQDKIVSMIGLAKRAERTVSGEFMTEKSVKGGQAYLVIVAADASDNTKKMFRNMCTYYKVPLYIYGTKELLGHGMGKESRASLAVIDKNFASAIIKDLVVAGIVEEKIVHGKKTDTSEWDREENGGSK